MKKERWRITFNTIKDRAGVISIYTEDWNGAVTDIEPAPSPIEVAEDDDDDMFKPVRGYTGYINVIDNGDLSDLMPTDGLQHYVELRIDGVLEWCGWMEPDTYTANWDVGPQTVSFPMVSQLEAMANIYLDNTKEMGMTNMAAMLYECITRSGATWDTICYPDEVRWSDYNYTDHTQGITAPFLPEFSRFTFFEKNESEKDDADYQRYDGESCKEYMEAFCSFWGWCARERGGTLYLISNTVSNYRKITVDELAAIARGEDVETSATSALNSYSLRELEPVSTDHRIERLQGAKKVRVTTEIKQVEEPDIAPEVEKKEWIVKGVLTAVGHTDEFEALEPKGNTVLSIYERRGTLWYKVDYDGLPVTEDVGCSYQRIDSRKVYGETKTNHEYREYLCIRCVSYGEGGTVDYPSMEEAADMVVFENNTDEEVVYESGALVISGMVHAIRTRFYGEIEKPKSLCNLLMSVSVGERSWNGDTWVIGDAVFVVGAGEESENGKIHSTKTLEMPYEGADGYVMPIDKQLSGKVRIALYAIGRTGYYDSYFDVMRIEELRIGYYKDDNLTEDKKRNSYSTITGRQYRHEYNKEIKFATNNGNSAAYNLLTHEKGPEKMCFLNRTSDDRVVRPEENLLGNLKRYKSRITERLTLQTEPLPGKSAVMQINIKGKTYMVLSERMSYADEAAEYTMEEKIE